MRLFLCVTSFIFLVSCAGAWGEPSEFEDGIVAVVNEDVITKSDLDIALSSVIAEYKEKYPQEESAAKLEQIRQDLLNQMIEDKLILQEARKRGVTVDDAEVEERIGAVKGRFSSDEDFSCALSDAGVTFEALRNRYKDQIMMSKLVAYEVREKVVVVPSEVNDYYDKYIDEFKAPEVVHLRDITICLEEGRPASLVKQKAEDIYRLAKGGRDFADLARQYSQGPHAPEGGDLGYIERGRMRKELDEAIFNLKAGEISVPIETEEGYRIFKVEERKESYVPSLEEVRDNVEDMIFQEKAKRRYTKWIDKLKQDAFIQLK